MAPELHFENPTVTIVPPRRQGGRYLLEFRPAERLACGHHARRALLWLVFLEEGGEAGREVTDTTCADCTPERFARLQAWAGELAAEPEARAR